MSYEVIFTPESEETFDLISSQLLENWGLKTVLKFQRLTSVFVEKVAEDPFLFQIVEELAEIRRYNIHSNCSVLYSINGNKVVIICFWDNRQDPVFG